MPILILIYKEISKIVEEKNIRRIICGDVSRNHSLMIRDLCDEKSIDFIQEDRNHAIYYYYEVISMAITSLLSFIILILDQLFSFFLSPIFTAETNSTIAIMFPVGRPEAFGQLYDFRNKFDTIYTLRFVSYIFKYRKVISKTAKVNIAQSNIDFGVLFSEVKLLGWVLYDTIYKKSLSRNISNWLYENENVNLDRLVMRLYIRTVLPNLDTIISYITATHLFKQKSYNKILLPGTTRTSRGVAYAAENEEIEIFHLHHGIGGKRIIADTLPQIRFTPGRLNQFYIEGSYNENIKPVPTGLPKHQKILEKKNNIESDRDCTASETALVATQPFVDEVRRGFVSNVVDAILTETDFHVVIKPHPGEDSEYYQRMINNKYDSHSRERITIHEEDLYEHLYNANITITINSNVAIESVIMGTPSLTYNKWAPDVSTPLYVDHGSIPKFISRDGLDSFLDELNTNRMIEEQDSMLYDDYMVYNNSVENIYQRIWSELDCSD